jgi:hypothetical protein
MRVDYNGNADDVEEGTGDDEKQPAGRKRKQEGVPKEETSMVRENLLAISHAMFLFALRRPHVPRRSVLGVFGKAGRY